MNITKRNILFFAIVITLTSCSSIDVKYYLPVDRSRIYSGLEVFIEDYADDYKGKTAILVTNHSGVDFYLNKNLFLLRKKGISISVAMAPEHGLYGYQDEFDKQVYNIDNTLNIIIYNLHKLNNKSMAALLKDTDLVIFDIQDLGMRCYTYISNLKFIIDAMDSYERRIQKGAAKELIVLDRPNPLAFLGIDGAYLEKKFKSKFISAFPGPFLYDMTLGESALYYKGEFKKKVKITVIEMDNYDEKMYYHDTSLPWVPPSPNLPTYESSIVYSAVVLMEGVNITLGRGTTKPFEYIGAPWIEPVSFCKGLEKLGMKSFRFRPVYFMPTVRKHKGEKCGGAQIFYVGGKFSPTEVSYKIIKYMMENYKQTRWTKFKRWYDVDYLAATDKFRKFIDARKPYKEFRKEISGAQKKYNRKREKYLLY
ncbi:MAG: DUF1343 domain-containing protein [bacterium]|nr:DUF1343 domain-containing protein [bacterium]